MFTENVEAGYALLTVNATDVDSGINAEIRYSLLLPVHGFTVDDKTGMILANRSGIALHQVRQQVIDLAVVATDSGVPPMSATAAVRIYVSNIGGGVNRFTHDEFR